MATVSASLSHSEGSIDLNLSKAPSTTDEKHAAEGEEYSKHSKLLDLSKKGLATLPDFSDFSALSELILEHNVLSELSSPLLVPPQLRVLNVSHNKISKIAEVIQLKATYSPVGLHTLNLAFNTISEFTSDLSCFPHLSILILNHNQLTEVKVSAMTLPAVTHLDLGNNSLSRLDPTLALLPKLEVIKVEGNCFRIPRYDIVRQGSSAVLQWCRARLPTAL
jgi:Leucine-rich repeat (LRR) protein